MEHSVEKLTGNKVKISFKATEAEFEAAIQKAYLKLRGQINVPGFRKGKAPRKMIENMFGKGVFYEDALEELFPDGQSVIDRDRMHKMLSMEIVKRVGMNRYWLDEKRAADGVNLAEGKKRILISGTPMAIPNWKIHNLVETSGGIVVCEETCTGTRYFENQVDESGKTVDEMIQNIADRYMSNWVKTAHRY